MIGQDSLVSDSVARAEGELARVDADTVPSWARFFLAPADINGIAAVVYTALAAHPEHRGKFAPKAIERATLAYDHRSDGENRSRTFDAISLASAHLLDGNLDQAAQHAYTALGMTAQIDSLRAVDRLRDLATLAGPHHNNHEIADIVDRIDTLCSVGR